jgi:hypothetical protein
MKKSLQSFEPKDIVIFAAMIGSFSLIIVFRKEPAQAGTFKDILTYIVVYYIGRKTEQMKSNGQDKN